MKTSNLPFPFNTRLKLSTLIRIAAGVEREFGRSPRCTVRQRQETLNLVAGHCATKAEAEEAIRASL